MKNRMKKILCLTLIATCMISMVACGKQKGELPEDAAARVQSEEDSEFVYIDDEILGLVRKKILNNIVDGNIVLFNGANKNNRARNIGIEIKLARL